jgi:putative membrane protein
MMGFGFVVARFGLFLRELAQTEHHPPAPATGWSFTIGTTFVALGVAVTLLAALEHGRFLRRLNRRQAYQAPRWSLAIVIAVLLAAVGIGLTAHLIHVGP